MATLVVDELGLTTHNLKNFLICPCKTNGHCPQCKFILGCYKQMTIDINLPWKPWDKETDDVHNGLAANYVLGNAMRFNVATEEEAITLINYLFGPSAVAIPILFSPYFSFSQLDANLPDYATYLDKDLRVLSFIEGLVDRED